MADANDDRYDLSRGGDPYDLSKGDPYDLSRGQDPFDISSGGKTSTASDQNGQSQTSASTGDKDKPGDDGLPTFNASKTYLVKGSTLNKIVGLIRKNTPKTVTGGGVKITQVTPKGTFLAIDAEQLTLSVCVNGQSVSKTFYVKPSTGG